MSRGGFKQYFFFLYRPGTEISAWRSSGVSICTFVVVKQVIQTRPRNLSAEVGEVFFIDLQLDVRHRRLQGSSGVSICTFEVVKQVI